MQNIYDPRMIESNELPLIANCNQVNDEVGWLIDKRTDIAGVPPCDHSMLSIVQGEFVCQDFSGYHWVPMESYLVNGGTIIFTEVINANDAFIQAFNKSVEDKLHGPWYRKTYNWLQIFGQAVGLPWISFPGLDDCSMDVIYHLKAAAVNLPKEDNDVIQKISNHANPNQFMQYQLLNPKVFNVKYIWDYKTGIVLPKV